MATLVALARGAGAAARAPVPVLIGDEALTDHLAACMHEAGLHVDSVKFPAVPRRQGRLRVILNAGHTQEDIDRLVAVFERHQALCRAAA